MKRAAQEQVAAMNWTADPRTHTKLTRFYLGEDGIVGDDGLKLLITFHPDGSVILHEPMTGQDMLLAMVECVRLTTNPGLDSALPT